jgi:hypothetical protein
MVNRQQQDSGRKPANQGVRDVIPESDKIGASTPYDFNGKNLSFTQLLQYFWPRFSKGTPSPGFSLKSDKSLEIHS